MHHRMFFGGSCDPRGGTELAHSVCRECRVCVAGSRTCKMVTALLVILLDDIEYTLLTEPL